MSQIKNAFGFIDECLDGLHPQGKGGRPLPVALSTNMSTWTERFSHECEEFLDVLCGCVGCAKCVVVKGKAKYLQVTFQGWDALWHVVSCLKYTRAWLEALFDAFPVLMDSTTLLDQMRPFIQLMQLSAAGLSSKGLITLQKYQTVRFFAESLGQSLPQQPLGLIAALSSETHPLTEARVETFRKGLRSVQFHRISSDEAENSFFSRGGWLPFTGRLRAHLKRIVSASRQFTMRNLSFLNTVLQGIKRGCEAAPESVVQAAKEKQRDVLSVPKSLPWGTMDGLDDFSSRLTRRFMRKGNVKFELTEASTSAAYGNPRSKGGAREAVKDVVLSGDSDSLISMNESGELRGICLGRGRENEVRRILHQRHRVPYPYCCVQEPGSQVWDFPLPFPAPERDLNDLRLGERKLIHSQVEAVLEPLKVRLITKSDALEQWVSRWMQRRMHDFLREMDQFRLIGEPLNGSHLQDVYRKTASLFSPEELLTARWESGDYEAATDSVSMDATKVVFENFLSKLPADLADLKPTFRDVLYEQFIHFKSNGTGPRGMYEDISYVQRSGQLMGSVLSFPVLCVINLWCFADALETYLGRRVPIRDLPCLINGDDFLALMPERLRRLWLTNVKSVGFKLSLGKNYTSRDFLLINSTLYKVMYPAGKEPVFRQIPFLNVGLLTGQSKVSGRANARLSPLDSWYNSVVEGAQSKDRAAKRFIHYHRASIEQLTWSGQWNLHLPLNRGGLGCVSHIPKGTYTTAFQRQYAHFIENELTNEEARKSLDLPGLTWTLKSEPLLSALPERHHGLVAPIKAICIGPLPEGIEVDTPPKPKAPLLYGCFLRSQEEGELRMTPPKRKYLKKFRSAICSELSNSEMLVPFRVARKVHPVEQDSPEL